MQMSVSYKIRKMESGKKLIDGTKDMLALWECWCCEMDNQSDKTWGNLQRMKAQGRLCGVMCHK